MTEFLTSRPVSIVLTVIALALWVWFLHDKGFLAIVAGVGALALWFKYATERGVFRDRNDE